MHNLERTWKCWGWCKSGGFQTVTVKATTMLEAIQKATKEHGMSVSHIE